MPSPTVTHKQTENELSNPQAEKANLDQLARLQQMKINTRLTALQSAQQLMATPGYTGIPGSDKVTKEPTWIRQPGAVDHLTLLAMAQDIETYILGNIESETIQAMEAAKRAVSGPKIVRP